jgi:hypothetical protein
MFFFNLFYRLTDFIFVYSQTLKRNSYLQPVLPTEQGEQQLQETVRRN